MLIVYVAIGVACCLLLTYGCLMLRRRRLYTLARMIIAGSADDGSAMSAAEQLWYTRALIEQPAIRTLHSYTAKNPQQLSEALAGYTDTLSQEQRAQLLIRAERVRRIRAERAEMKLLLPRLSRALYAAAPTLDVILSRTLQSAPHQLAEHAITAHLQATHQAGQAAVSAHADTASGTLLDSAAQHAQHAAHVLGHIPVLTLATTSIRYKGAVDRGLDLDTALLNGGIDVAARGGGAMIGAHALGTFIPVIGHLVGGVIGGLVGTWLSDQNMQAPLKAADALLRDQLAVVGTTVTDQAWRELSSESHDLLEERRATLLVLIEEEESAPPPWHRRHLAPRLVDVVIVEALSVGLDDITVEEADIAELDSLLAASAGHEHAKACMAAMALARPSIGNRLGVEEQLRDELHTTLAYMEAEREKLALQRGSH